MPRRLVCIAIAVATVAAAPGSGDASPRIVGGGKANPAGWRFAVAIEQKRTLICTGSLIGPTTVLTAAHCVKGGKRRQLSVLAGSASIAPKRRPPRIKVTRVVIDPTYNGRKVERDFAVLTLARASAAEPIELPSRAEAMTSTRPGRIIRAAGFRGATMICAVGMRLLRSRSRLPFRSTTCTGDSGGPAVASTPGGPRLVGVTSAGAFPCGLFAPSIYARVASRLGFIQRAAGLDPG